MFEKLSQAAERAATGVSRRQFLRRLGQGSLIAAAGLGTLLASPGDVLGPGSLRQGSPQGPMRQFPVEETLLSGGLRLRVLLGV